MLLPVNWLKEYVDIDKNIRELSDGLTYSGSHVESIIDLDRGIENVVVGKIIEIKEHENADKLVVCKVDIGDETLQIVTGAENIFEGAIVPVALEGAKLYGDLEIKKGKLRGIESYGMLCSLEELGYSDNVIPSDAKDGIYLINDDVRLGTDINQLMGLYGHIFEIEVTPNRPDCLSVIGLARETAATFGVELKEPKIEIKEEFDNIDDYLNSVEIESENCIRYYTRVIKDVKIESSPIWLQRRLMEAGMRPVNNIVDITNYILLEYGQPLHAFDLDKLEGKKIRVRQAEEGEKITTIDHVERELSEENLVIADENKAIAIAGVMGGSETEISDETKTVVLESANFDAKSVRLTSKEFNLRSEASTRYEKGNDPNICKKAGDRFCQLVEEIGAGKVVEGYIDLYEEEKKPKVIEFKPENANKLLGTEISESQMVKYFKGLEFDVDTKDEKLEVTVPTYRLDLSIEEDLIEEVGRLYGFHNIEPKPLSSGITRGRKPYKRIVEDKAKNILSSLGLNEILTYSFISPKDYDKLLINEEDSLRDTIELINPLGEDMSVMRTTLVSNMLDTISRNYNRNIESAELYEIGNIFEADKLPLVELPEENRRLVIGAYGDRDFYGIKEVLNITLGRLGINEVDYIRETENPTYHPGRTANIVLDGINIGLIGEVHTDVLDNYNIDERVYIVDIDFEEVIKKTQLEIEYKELPKYPSMTRDLALVLDENILSGDIEKIMINHGKELIEKIELFDVYDGDQIPEGKKSMAYTIVYRSYDRTLTDNEVNNIQENLIKDLEETFNAELRS